jgi:Protein of unknown function (DUF4229)
VSLSGGNGARSPSRAFFIYNVLRLGLLVVCLGVGWLVGIHSVWLIVGSLLVSGVLSWFLLRRQREAMGAAVEQTVERSRLRMAAHTTSEDSYVDALHAEPAPGDPPTS